MSSRRKAMLLLATNNKWLPYSYEYLLNSLVPTTIDNRNVLNQSKIIKLYGNGCVVNQMLDESAYPAERTINGITITYDSATRTITLNGTATSTFSFDLNPYFNIVNGCYYLIKANVNEPINSRFYLRWASVGPWLGYYYIDNGTNTITGDICDYRQCTQTNNNSFKITIQNGSTFNNFKIKDLQYWNISHSFGLGNEPTSINDNRIQAILNRGYIPYNTGEYVGTDISEIVSYDTNNNLLATIPFKAQLNGAINSHDTLEITNTAYVFEKNIGIRAYQSGDESLTNVLTDLTNTYYQLTTPQTISIPRKHLGIVDLGSLTWNYNSNLKRFTSNTITFPHSQSYQQLPTNIYCSKYNLGTHAQLDSASNDGIIGTTDRTSAFYLIIRDTQYTDATTFKTAMSGTYLFYETQDEVDDIVDKIGIEAGGSLSANEFSYVENQLLNFNTATQTENGITKSFSNNSFSIVGTTTSSSWIELGNYKCETNHKYLIMTNYDTSSLSGVYFYSLLGVIRNTSIITASSSSANDTFYFVSTNTSLAINKNIKINIVDLTTAFGSRNEPTMITDKEIQYLINKGYIAYNPDGTLVSVSPLALLNLDTKMKCK